MKRELIICGVATGIFVGGSVFGFQVCKRFMISRLQGAVPVLNNVVIDIMKKVLNGQLDDMTDEELDVYLQTELDFFTIAMNNI